MSEKTVWQNVCGICAQPKNLLAMAATLLVSYGYWVLFPAVGVDDIPYALEHYYKGEYILQGRFSHYIYRFLWGNQIYVQHLFQILFLLFFAVSAFVFTAWLYTMARRQLDGGVIVFSCAMVAYPLLAEHLLYDQEIPTNAFGFLLCSLAVCLLYPVQKKLTFTRVALGVLCICIALSGYQSFGIVYLTMALCGALLRVFAGQLTRWKQLFGQLFYAGGCLAAAMMLSKLITKAIMILFSAQLAGITSHANAAILWIESDKSLLGRLHECLWENFIGWVAPFGGNLAVTLFDLACLALVVVALVKGRKAGKSLMFGTAAITVCVAQLALGFLRGTFQGYRTCHNLSVFCGFVLWTLWCCLPRQQGWKRRVGVLACAACIALQAFSTCYTFVLDQERQKIESNALQQIGQTVRPMLEQQSKPLVFTGAYELPQEYLTKLQVYPYAPYYALDIGTVRTIYNREYSAMSVIGWSMGGLTGVSETQDEIRSTVEWFTGLQYPACTPQQIEQALQQSEAMPRWPAAGSIQDRGEYIIVNF